MDKNHSFYPPRRTSDRGVALVIVLSTLVLLIGLVVVIISRVTSARAVSSSYSTGVNCRVYADSAINMVVGQLKDATSDTSQTVSWASQPGAIRTYQGTNFKTGYKLFSSSIMQSDVEATFAQDADAQWKSKPGQYVNINTPFVKDGIKVYPIADPAILTTDPNSTHYVQGFSVLDDKSTYQQNLEMPVEWLYLRKDGTVSTGQYNTGTGAVDLSGTSESPVVARVAFWTDDECSKVNINTASEGMYWDTPHINTGISKDEPAKSYLSDQNYPNSATNNADPAAATFRANGMDLALAFNQPATNEYNRFPGHPAMTSLSAVFPFLNPTQIFQLVPRVDAGGSTMGTKSTVFTYESIQGFADSDRLYDSPAELAIRALPSPPASPAPARVPNADINGASPVSPAQVRERSFLMTANSRSPELNLLGRPRVVMWPVSAVTNSPLTNSPARTAYDELIAFCGTLRSTIVDDGTDPTTSLTKWPFVFFRQAPYVAPGEKGSDADIASNQALLDYLHDVTAHVAPGFKASLASKYGADCDQILTEMLDYIRCTNIFDTSLEPAGWDSTNPSTGGEYTNGTFEKSWHGKPGRGQVLPLQFSKYGTTRGLGRTPTVTEVALHLICTADYAEGGRLVLDHDKGTLLDGTPPSNYHDNITLGQYIDPPANTKRKLLGPGQKQIQAMLHVELASPMVGYPTIADNLEVQISGAQGFTVPGVGGPVTLFPGTGSLKTFQSSIFGTGSYNKEGETFYQGVATGGYMGFAPFVFLGRFSGGGPLSSSSAAMQLDKTYYTSNGSARINNPFISYPFTVDKSVLNVSGASLQIDLYYPPDSAKNTVRQLYQHLTVNFPSFNMSTPRLDVGDPGAGTRPLVYRTSWAFNQDGYQGNGTDPDGRTPPYDKDAIRVGGRFCQSRPFSDQNLLNYLRGSDNFIRPLFDSIQSMELKDGDFRRTSLMPSVGADEFILTKPGPAIYEEPGTPDKPPVAYPNMAHSLTNAWTFQFIAGGANYNTVMDRVKGRAVGDHPSNAGVAHDRAMDFPLASQYPIDRIKPSDTGDWDQGIGNQTDGPYANMSDGGNFIQLRKIDDPWPPYFFFPDHDTGSLAKGFAPNRQMPSSGMFGSLPTGTGHGSWRTLLFRPQPGHPAAQQEPPDHLFMDLFWMPVVQPYAISEPFSTAGKINMNYQILPFTYIKRQTAMYALLKAERMLTISNLDGPKYRIDVAIQSKESEMWRRPIDIKPTLDQFETRFDNHEIFRSATQICDLYLVPDNKPAGSLTASAMPSYWSSHTLTGDNARERPYTNIYPRLTTQSNTYQVHYWVQTVKQTSNHPKTFIDPESTAQGGAGRPQKDAVTGQLRGSSLVERFLNPNDPRFSQNGFSTGTGSSGTDSINPRKDSLNGAYKMRVYGATVFPP